jgi:hypothetical protein
MHRPSRDRRVLPSRPRQAHLRGRLARARAFFPSTEGQPSETFSGTWTPWGTTRAGASCPRQTPVRPTRGTASGSSPAWPTLTQSDGNRGGDDLAREGGPSLRHLIRRSDNASSLLNPEWTEILMGFPQGYTELPSHGPRHTDAPDDGVHLRTGDGLGSAASLRPRWPAPPGPQYDWEPPRTTGRGVPNRARRVGALGNAVIPQIPEAIGRAILAADERAVG